MFDDQITGNIPRAEENGTRTPLQIRDRSASGKPWKQNSLTKNSSAGREGGFQEWQIKVYATWTGILMEGDFTHPPGSVSMSAIEMLRQPFWVGDRASVSHEMGNLAGRAFESRNANSHAPPEMPAAWW
jgi:hypothetical protein